MILKFFMILRTDRGFEGSSRLFGGHTIFLKEDLDSKERL